MTRRFRIGAIHALQGSIEPTQAAFDRHWPDADVAHLLDASLYLDRSAGTADAAEIARRIDALVRHSVGTGSEAVLFTGSFFAAAVRQARPSVDVPVQTSFDGLLEAVMDAAADGKSLTVVSTAPDSTTLLVEEIEALALERGLPVTVRGEVVPGAMDALVASDLPRHDQLVRDAIAALPPDQLGVMAQFSMERIFDVAPGSEPARVLGPADQGVRYLKRILAA